MNVLKLARIIILLMIPSTQALSGDHVCSRTENYTVTRMEPFVDYVTVKTYGWCFSFPPRCTETRVEERTNYRVQAENKTRIVFECCEGYVKRKDNGSDAEDETCVPFCENCDAESCISPNKCRCEADDYGKDCDNKCPTGFWGENCKQICDCAKNIPCDRTNGNCQCSPGLKGLRCEETCSHGLWGSGCANRCTCTDALAECHHETGVCSTVVISDTETLTPLTQTETTVDFQWTDVLATSDFESTLVGETENQNDFEIVTGKISLDSAVTSRPDISETSTLKEEKNLPSTIRPVVVLVSLPERRNLEKSYSKITLNDAYLGHFQDESGRHIGTSSRIDYMKTFQKEDVTATISLEITMIVIASIVSLGLTAAAAITIVHMRSKAVRCEAVRPPSVYCDEKTKSQERESGGTNSTRIPAIITSALPQTPVCVSPNFGTLLAISNSNDTNTYANGSATIALQMPGNFGSCLLDSHYDKPPATLSRLHTSANTNAEHIYDEIPLQSAGLYTNKTE